MTEPKTYGLILPKKGEKKKQAFVKKPSIFDDDDDEEDDKSQTNIQGRKEVKRVGTDFKLKKQTQIQIEKALEQDPSVYEYDSVYDQIHEDKKAKDARIANKGDKKPKYIQNLLKAADQRKKEYERQVERKVQKQLEKEAGMYDDSQKFVTSAYKKKMKEMQEEEEREKRQRAIEAHMDVTKQQDMSGFYRHLLNQTTGEEAIPDNTKVKVKHEADVKPEKPTRSSKEPHAAAAEVDFDQDRDLSQSSSSSGSDSDSDSDSGSSEREQPDVHPSSHDQQKPSDDSNSREERKHHKASPNRDSYHDSRLSKSHHKDYSDREKDRRTNERKRGQDRDRDRGRSDRDYDRRKYEESNERPDRRGYDKDRSIGRDHYASDRHQSHRTDHNRSDKDKTGKDDRSQRDKEKRPRDKSASVEKPSQSKTKEKIEIETRMAKFAKKTTGENLDDARMRYLARRQDRTVITSKEDD